MDEVAKRIAGQGKEQHLSDRATRARLNKEIRECEREMEAAFKLQLKAESGSASERFVLDKLEALGRKKAALENSLAEFEESKDNLISLDEVRQDLEDRVIKVTKGWSKLPAAQKRRVLRQLIQKLAVGPKGLDIYYYNCAT